MRNLITTASPHIHDGSSTRSIMLDVIIALTPTLIAATILFGPQALVLAAVTVFSAVLFEMVAKQVMRKDITSVFDLSAVVTGLILALSMPSNIPLWLPVGGAFVSIVIVKQLLGGVLGRNPVNPALIGRLTVSRAMRGVYPGYPVPLTWSYGGVDTLTMATPLHELTMNRSLPSYGELFLGLHGGTMGEVSTVALLLGGGYLVWRHVISPVIPMAFIGTTMLVVAFAGQDPLAHMLTGGLAFAAIFMATDYSTSPITIKGKFIFAVGCGLMVAYIRLGSGPTDGITHALITMNLLVPFIDRFTLPKAFGYKNG